MVVCSGVPVSNVQRKEQAGVGNAKLVWQLLHYRYQYFDAETGLYNDLFRYHVPYADSIISRNTWGLPAFSMLTADKKKLNTACLNP